MKPYQSSEWGKLRDVMVYTPGIEVAYAQLAPIQSLYKGFIKLEKAVEQHEELKRTLGEYAHVWDLKEVILKNENILKEYLKDKVSKFYSSEIEKKAKEIIESYSPEHLWTLIVLRPEDIVHPYDESDIRKKGMNVLIHPLGNLYFMRDQQFITDKGMVIGNCNMPARKPETEVVELGWKSIGIQPIYKMENPFEGGDFIPLGDTVFIGRGYRNTWRSINEILEKDLFTAEEVSIFVQPSAQNTMHLDTYFNLIAPTLGVGCEDVLKTVEVCVYQKDDDHYIFKSREQALNYLKRKGIEIISITRDEQERCGTNFLTIEENKIIFPNNSGLERVKKTLEKHGTDVILVNTSELQKGYGGIHCMTAVIRRD